MFSYDEDDMVEDPNLAQHLAHFGINITQMEKVHLYIECGSCVASDHAYWLTCGTIGFCLNTND